MKKIIAVLCMLSLINLATLQAGPVEKKPFNNDDLLSLSRQQIASAYEVRKVEAGFLGAASALINLALYGALLYGGYKLSDSIRN